MKPYRVIISGGGTGGHIFPAIAIANTIKKRFPDAEILFVGAEDRMEMERVPAAGYKIIGLPVVGFNRKKLMANIEVLKRLRKSLKIAKETIRDFKPDIAIGVGGYASGPTLWEAAKQKIPVLIQEQNSYAGVTNKLLAKKALKICVAYDEMEKFFPADKIVFTGNPVRKVMEKALENKNEAYEYFGFSLKKKTILIVGGSLGARTINESVRAGIEKLVESGVQIIWQTGKAFYPVAQKTLEPFDSKDIWCSDFITRMEYAYAVSDLVISRAGAGSISELCLLKKAAILVPSPNVAEDHQTKNTMALVKRNAAIMIADKDAEQDLIPTALEVIWNENKLHSLSHNIRVLAQYGSSERIVNEVIKIIDKDNESK